MIPLKFEYIFAKRLNVIVCVCLICGLKLGVTSYKVDLESKRVVVTGDIIPYEVLESVSKVKNAEIWIS